MYYAIRQPCHDAEEGARVCGEDVAQVGTVEYVLERWENADPYWRAPSAGDEPGRGQVSRFSKRRPRALQQSREPPIGGGHRRGQTAEEEGSSLASIK